MNLFKISRVGSFPIPPAADVDELAPAACDLEPDVLFCNLFLALRGEFNSLFSFSYSFSNAADELIADDCIVYIYAFIFILQM